MTEEAFDDLIVEVPTEGPLDEALDALPELAAERRKVQRLLARRDRLRRELAAVGQPAVERLRAELNRVEERLADLGVELAN